MKKAVLTAIEQIEIIEVDKPELVNSNDVLIKMSVMGICGSDIHYYATGRIGNQIVEFPFCIGHEGAGIVEAVGAEVTKVKIGDRIAVEPSVSCGYCDQCLSGRPHTCRNNLFLGCPGQIEGNLAEYIIMSEDQCLKMPDHLLMEHGATSEPLSIGLYAVKKAELSKSDKIGIIGFGPIGMSVLQMVGVFNISHIFVSEKIEERIALANSNGAYWTGNPLKINIVEEIAKIEPDLLDVVFECCGKQEALDTAIDLVKPGGKIIMIGIPEFDNWSISADKARRKEITFINIRRQNNCTHETLQLMAEGKVNGSAMITHRFTLNEVAQAFDMVKNYKNGVMKALIEF